MESSERVEWHVSHKDMEHMAKNINGLVGATIADT